HPLRAFAGKGCSRARPHSVSLMSTSLLVVQILNGLQLGVLLFLIAAGLTLVFGVMDFINLAHGVQYMLGAYFAVAFYALTGSFLAALVLALAATLAFGLLLEFAVFRHLYDRDHLDHVIATFGIILFLNHGVKLVWGAAPLSLPMPELFSGSVKLADGLLYPVWRLVVIASGLLVAALLIGLVDTLGRSFSVDILRLVMGPSPARTVGPAIASMLIYLLMALVLYIRPTGLFPAKGR